MRALAISMLSLGLCVSCAEHEPVAPSSYPSSGLYTPGSTLGASDPTDTPMMGRSNRCVPLPPVPGVPDGGAVGTSGTLKVEYMTQTSGGQYAPRNISAVWVETMAGAYVATIELSAAIRRKDLVYFQDRACTDGLGPDVIVSATQRTHEKMHVAEWTGLDFEGKGVPDGPYKLYIEVTETDLEPGELNTYDFTKGPEPFTMTLPVPVDGMLLQATATWAVQ